MDSGIELQLFEWKEWDPLSTMSFKFYDVVLLVKIGKFKKGTHFDYAILNLEQSELALILDEESYMFDLKITASNQ